MGQAVWGKGGFGSLDGGANASTQPRVVICAFLRQKRWAEREGQ